MKEFKGTKGQWVEYPNGEVVSYETGNIIAESIASNADRKLIATAPELLEALKKMAEMYDEIQPTGGYQEYHDQAVSAINKALFV